MTERIFALDIGTRKVMGLLARAEGDGVVVDDAELVEHPTRSMSAGQIQDVPRVAAVVRETIAALEARCGKIPTKAAVAVAGRNLKTVRGRAKLPFARPQQVTAEDSQWCVQQALQEAQRQLGPSDASAQYHQCVGYVVTWFSLDGETLSQPVGHVGETLEAEVLATFLPRRVLDSLFSVLEASGLEALCVTLEPIAALQAAVPEGLRRFHLALVDIGAGTSDIAIVREGRVRAFGMVPMAGDFVTDRISDQCLVDFFTAERLKCSLASEGPIEALDLFHRPRHFAPAEIRRGLEPAVKELARQIAAHILDLAGGQAPQLVVCVGGGSLTPGIEDAISDALGIERDRVGFRAPSIQSASPAMSTPQAVTPLGIALVARDKAGLRFRRVYLNEKPVHLLDSGATLTVQAAFVAAGVPPDQIYGRPGPARTYTLNGKVRAVRGFPGSRGRISVNGQPAGLDRELRENDRIKFEPGSSGAEGIATLREALAEAAVQVRINGDLQTVFPNALLDGAHCNLDAELPDRARIAWDSPATAWEAAEKFMHHSRGHRHDSSSVTLKVLLNGAPASRSSVLCAGDQLDVSVSEPSLPFPEPLPEAPLPFNSLRVRLNGEEIVLQPAAGPGERVMLFDLFRHVPMNLSAVPGKRLRLLINGESAGFTSPLHHDAEVRVFFE
ncbi:MAG: hypothetical protein HY078_11845 [Elusimicrobia bacterium]|nr:hypothetical protein [Elusimicrobiota bacterium]